MEFVVGLRHIHHEADRPCNFLNRVVPANAHRKSICSDNTTNMTTHTVGRETTHSYDVGGLIAVWADDYVGGKNYVYMYIYIYVYMYVYLY